jgi:hypothetical protein
VLPNDIEIVPMQGKGATRISDHENIGGEGEAKGNEMKDEDEGVEAVEFLHGHRHGGVEVRGWHWGGYTATGHFKGLTNV